MLARSQEKSLNELVEEVLSQEATRRLHKSRA